MAVNQTQVDDIISAASVEDPAVRLQSLEREVDLLKISIKHILMDIRERMNEMENPFTIISSPPTDTGTAVEDPDSVSRESEFEAREAAINERESQLEREKKPLEPELPVEKNSSPDDTAASDLQKYLASGALSGIPAPQLPEIPHIDPMPLQKAYNFFKWTQHGVKKYGHSRLEILAESYCLMGYIGKETVDEIRQISQLMPMSIGEEKEIDPYDFVSEIYSLNRILSPHDTSLDRGMIEVMMTQHQQGDSTTADSIPQGMIPESARHPEPEDALGIGNVTRKWMNTRF
ncbi:hypothetical protein [Methanoregula sp.]|uniref:hypothetical protein n=1 Tax=Methanoregula sp. TaxID=2052170 RepID=UPI00236F89D5|nr:hypothetical protein [Methanoregula sp.]MDD1686793.1 hypothetical protein [Methanoregula sp.]